ncbi:OmpL47-type beta-barrel domain-containing protein [Streptomyces sp. LaPpAH-108]|uniref:OmpL47-type beta-barrel domain-containing protein n=1 Tax=Streptomyces sp. LaPpAH-108 TaxID=1155714 RepID=UPI00131A1478|nr:hypothetical protein [Streptomyces sp. LaPpAH-108]
MNTQRYQGRTALGMLALAVTLLMLAAAGASAAAQRAGTMLTVRFINNSDRDLTPGGGNYNGCPANLPQRIAAGTTATWTLSTLCGPTDGNVGNLRYNVYRESAQVQIGWDAPIVGDATYTQSAPSGYVISHSGGQGINPTVDFTFDCNSTTCDGIPDNWKRNGIYINPADGSAHTAPAPGLKFIDLPGMGATVDKPDIFVQLDWMANDNHSHALAPAAIKQVVDAFANSPYSRHSPTTGINLHVDAGPDSIMNFATNATWGTLSTARQLPEQTNLGTSVGGMYQWNAFNTIKNQTGGFTSTGRAPIFHYAISAHNLESGSSSSGIAPTPGSDLIVSLGSFAGQVGTVAEQAGTFLHELGHNLNLEHGGDQNVNNKPQYFSSMNYLYQFGLTSGTTSGLTDLSRRNTSLDENSLDERSYPASSGTYDVRHWCPGSNGGSFVLVPAADGQVDWNCNGVIDTAPVSFDVNNDGQRTTLTGFDDWSNVLLRVGAVGRTEATGDVPPPTREDELTPSEAELNLPLDTEPPVTRARVAPCSAGYGANRPDVCVTLTAKDRISGVARTEYRLDGGKWKTYTSPVTVHGKGKHVLRFRSVDYAQNLEKTKSVTVSGKRP